MNKPKERINKIKTHVENSTFSSYNPSSSANSKKTCIVPDKPIESFNFLKQVLNEKNFDLDNKNIYYEDSNSLVEIKNEEDFLKILDYHKTKKVNSNIVNDEGLNIDDMNLVLLSKENSVKDDTDLISISISISQSENEDNLLKQDISSSNLDKNYVEANKNNNANFKSFIFTQENNQPAENQNVERENLNNQQFSFKNPNRKAAKVGQARSRSKAKRQTKNENKDNNFKKISKSKNDSSNKGCDTVNFNQEIGLKQAHDIRQYFEEIERNLLDAIDKKIENKIHEIMRNNASILNENNGNNNRQHLKIEENNINADADNLLQTKLQNENVLLKYNDSLKYLNDNIKNKLNDSMKNLKLEKNISSSEMDLLNNARINNTSDLLIISASNNNSHDSQDNNNNNLNNFPQINKDKTIDNNKGSESVYNVNQKNITESNKENLPLEKSKIILKENLFKTNKLESIKINDSFYKEAKKTIQDCSHFEKNNTMIYSKNKNFAFVHNLKNEKLESLKNADNIAQESSNILNNMSLRVNKDNNEIENNYVQNNLINIEDPQINHVEKLSFHCSICQNVEAYVKFYCLICDYFYLCETCEKNKCHSNHPLITNCEEYNSFDKEKLLIFSLINSNMMNKNIRENNYYKNVKIYRRQILENNAPPKIDNFENFKKIMLNKNILNIEVIPSFESNINFEKLNNENIISLTKKKYEKFKLSFLICNNSDIHINPNELIITSKNNSLIEFETKTLKESIPKKQNKKLEFNVVSPNKIGTYYFELFLIHLKRKLNYSGPVFSIEVIDD